MQKKIYYTATLWGCSHVQEGSGCRLSKLVLAEKPSVAQALSKVLGATRRGDGYLEGNGYVVSWCVGHLVELAPPEAYGDQYKKWRKDDLPIFPEPFMMLKKYLYSIYQVKKIKIIPFWNIVIEKNY